MANKKNSAADAAIGALIVIGVIIYFAILAVFSVVPLVFLIYSIICFVRFRGNLDRWDIQHDFWLTKSEKESFVKIYSALRFYKNKKDEAWQAVSNEGISINKDGGISRKSYRGQELRGAIEESEEKIKYFTPQLEELEKVPLKNWRRVRRHFTNRIAMPVAIAVGLVCAPFIVDSGILYGSTTEEEKISESPISSATTDNDTAVSIEDGGTQDINNSAETTRTFLSFFNFFASCGMASSASWIICWIVMAIIYGRKFPRPDIVTIGNVYS